MSKFIIKLLIICFPFLLVIAIYLYDDPFKVLYNYENYYEPSFSNDFLNRDYISTESFIKNSKKCNYDSYIFGSSRSEVYQVDEWTKHINSKACFHYDAYKECLYGVEKKVIFIHKKGLKIKNALFIFDSDLLPITTNLSGPVYRKHPRISGESQFSFQSSMFASFLDVESITTSIKSIINHIKSLDTGQNFIQHHNKDRYVKFTNEERWWWVEFEAAIARNRDSFYQHKSAKLYHRDSIQKFYDPTIKQEQIAMLMNIKKILYEDQCKYKIIISPLYNQLKINPKDRIILDSIFGAKNVYDYSGINTITENVYNYYEDSHYRTHVATQILNDIYTN